MHKLYTQKGNQDAGTLLNIEMTIPFLVEASDTIPEQTSFDLFVCFLQVLNYLGCLHYLHCHPHLHYLDQTQRVQ